MNKKPKVAPVKAASDLKKQLKKMSLNAGDAKKKKINMADSSSDDDEKDGNGIAEQVTTSFSRNKMERGLSRADHIRFKKEIRRLRSQNVHGCKKAARRMSDKYEEKQY